MPAPNWFDFEDECGCEHVTCWQCGGEGGFHDCGEDCCACLYPELDINWPCDICEGKGGWIQHESNCPNATAAEV